MAKTIISKLTSILEIGRQEAPYDLFTVEVFSPSRSSFLQIVILGNGEPMHLTLWRDQAEKPADRLSVALDRSIGGS